ncbi:MAG TPA: AAA family ATPase [Flexivirga sp.]|uniref:AAA family ATPase n=1 Tax=Flexivirga sp. TaxID=1962927 RepID=UPI002B578E1B|nr:AAA family ATPase [Flexivirga sp.]HWC22245.1 AAA family ATPase [Flexivirga sp.]
MTVLWDPAQSALDTFRIALGDDLDLVAHGAAVTREVDNGGHHLVVIGPDVPAESAYQLAEQLRIDRPAVGVLLLRHRLEVAVLTQALRSGVREVVQADDHAALVDAARRSEALSAQMGATSGGSDTTGHVVTVFSAKGGVGKTTVSVNLAAYLASNGARTLLIDLDLMFGDVGICLQLPPTTSIMDLVSMTGHLDAQGMASVVQRHEASGLDVLVAPHDPADADRVPADLVSELIRLARTNYDYVVLDMPPSMPEHVLGAFDLSDLLVLVSTLDIPAVKNLRLAINTLDALGASQQNRLLVLNRSDLKVGLSSKDVEAALCYPVSAKLPNALSVPAASNRGMVLAVDNPKDNFAVALREFADHKVRPHFGEEPTRSGGRRIHRRKAAK